MKILTDTREQLPYTFSKYPVNTESAALPVGDYSIPGFESTVSIERKSLNDLVGCLTGKNRERFERELMRARSYELFAVVVEANIQDVSDKKYKSDMTPHAVMQSITAFHIRYGIPFLFCGDRSGGEYTTYSLLQKYIYEIGKRYKQSVNA